MNESFSINGQEIRPGTSVVLDLPVMNLSTHTPMTMPLRVIRGRRPGPVLFVCAALHGDEINGVEIIRRLVSLSALRHLRGTLLAVPIVNLFGFLAHSRYLPDRRDLNRSFPGSPKGSLAARLADLFMKEVVSKATHGIDLHTAAIHRTNFPQIRADLDDEETHALARAFGVPVIVNAGLREGSLRAAAGNLGVRVIVYEAGEALRFNETDIRAGVQGVVRVMRKLGMLPEARPGRRVNSPVAIRSSRWVRAPSSGIFRAEVELGSTVESGARLGELSDPFGEVVSAVVARDQGVVVGRTTLPVVQEGDALFHIGRTQGTKATADALDAFEPDETYDIGITSELADEPQIV